jgi:hypothetical protein
MPFNYPTWQQYQPLLMSGHVNDWVSDTASATAAGVPYPYAGFSQLAYNALKQYPQTTTGWGGILTINPPIGRSGYNSFTTEISKRGKSGLSMDLSYNYNRRTGNVCDGFAEWYWWGPCNQQDPYQYNNSKYWGDPLTNQGVKGYVAYELPVGRGKMFLSGAHGFVDELVSGWAISGIVNYFNGSQINAIGSTNSYPGWAGVWANVAPNANFSNTFKTWNPAWDPSAGPDPNSLFVNPANFSNPTFGQLGNSPKVYNWRSWWTPTENFSIVKHLRIGSGERVSASIRADFFNVFNRHYWNSPNLDMSSPYFGHVTGVSGNRTGQLGARIQF